MHDQRRVTTVTSVSGIGVSLAANSVVCFTVYKLIDHVVSNGTRSLSSVVHGGVRKVLWLGRETKGVV